MVKKKQNLGKKEYKFSKSYYKRKRKLLKRMFDSGTRRKKPFCNDKKSDNIL